MCRLNRAIVIRSFFGKSLLTIKDMFFKTLKPWQTQVNTQTIIQLFVLPKICWKAEC